MLVTEITAQSIDAALRKQLDALNTSVESRETGSVIQVGDGIARVDGLKNAMAGELLEFTSSTGQVVYGMAQNLEEDCWAMSQQSRKTTRSRPPVVWLRFRPARPCSAVS